MSFKPNMARFVATLAARALVGRAGGNGSALENIFAERRRELERAQGIGSALETIFADRRRELEQERRRRRFWQGVAAVLALLLLLALFVRLPSPAPYCERSSLPWLACHG